MCEIFKFFGQNLGDIGKAAHYVRSSPHLNMYVCCPALLVSFLLLVHLRFAEFEVYQDQLLAV